MVQIWISWGDEYIDAMAMDNMKVTRSDVNSISLLRQLDSWNAR